MISPNSISSSKQPDPPVELGLQVGHDNNLYKTKPAFPRRYHKYLNQKDKSNIYGTEQADSLYGNVSEIEVCDLTTNQIDFLLSEQRDYK